MKWVLQDRIGGTNNRSHALHFLLPCSKGGWGAIIKERGAYYKNRLPNGEPIKEREKEREREGGGGGGGGRKGGGGGRRGGEGGGGGGGELIGR